MNDKQKLVTETINAALKNTKVPTVGAQKKEYYKAGMCDLVRLIQAEIDKLNN